MATRANIRVVSAEIQRDGAYLLTQRQAHAVLPDLWEFPGGRVREGEDDATALRRAFELRLGCVPEVDTLVMEVTHAYDTYDLTLAVYRCSLDCEPQPLAVQAVHWVEDFTDYRFPDADQKTVDLLLSETGESTDAS